ncbi:DNA internalization-related competence protein ComEC/Rec2 [Bacillus aerolatus]|uniref:DNA internalization-related competence protein ComEC/Rec2 n=1 Tax=Bacillus aerolatus TaxID=2653354 RepID=A0A6I1FN69_9BACI|nr:DNA internalization-related competence protein ComEC/Rec2 [Bacillus aerolatus]KAB7708711.1 DNA internalization-related competence protein ComEC/Rec2 [Bacillus aerolatus]
MRGNLIYMAAGTLAGLLWALPALSSVRLLLTAAAFFFVIRMDAKRKAAFLICIILGFLIGQYHEEHNVTAFTGKEEKWLVSFSEDTIVDGDRLKATVEAANEEKLRLLYRVSSREEAGQLRKGLIPGTVCYVTGSIEKPDGARNRNGFDYKTFLETKHIFWQLKVNRLSLSSCLKKEKSFKDLIFLWRAEGLNHLKTTFPESLQPVAAALLFGDRTLTEEDIIEAYQRLGVIHLLAISGLHVGLVTSIFYYAMIRIGLVKETAQFILLFSLPIYALIAGGSPPVVRAVLMTLLVLLSIRFHHKFTALDALGASFMFVIFHDPYVIYQAGFQLSYLVSFSLLLSSSSILSIPSTLLGKMAAMTSVSQIAGLPVLMYQFFEVSLYSFAANLFFVPFYSFLVLPLLIIVYLLSFAVSPAVVLLEPLRLLLDKIDQLAVEVSGWPFAVVVTGRPEGVLLAAICMMWVAAFLFWEKANGLKRVGLMLLMMIGTAVLPHTHSATGEVSFIDVGQGDAILITLPFNNGNYLIDTGGVLPFHKEEWQKQKKDFTIGKDVLLPYLKSRGITRIDKLILTHSDYDHIGAAAELFGLITIKEVMISPGSESKPVMQETIQQAATHKIPVRYGKYMESWQAGGAFFQILSPADKHYEGNDDSLVIYAVLGGKKWLFTGDMEEEGEKKLTENFSADVDILKVGHHGSRSSTTELLTAETAPEDAVISLGKNNRYGHPHKEVIERLQKQGARIWRTDLHGEITYTYKRERGTFSAVLP